METFDRQMLGIKAAIAKLELDNIRDRRTLVSALLMGPIFGPVMFAFVINMSIDRALDDATEGRVVVPVDEPYAGRVDHERPPSAPDAEESSVGPELELSANQIELAVLSILERFGR